MHAIVWKIRVILLQTFVWIVDLKVREHLTEYLKKDIKYHQVIIEVLGERDVVIKGSVDRNIYFDFTVLCI